MRDRKPLARFCRQGLRAAAHRPARHSRWSASTPRRSNIEIYRIGDRNLIDTVLGRDFQRNLDRYDVERLTESRGVKVWKRRARGRADAQRRGDDGISGRSGGRRSCARRLCDDGDPAKGATSDDATTTLATQWFIVSDLGLAAYSGNDGINVFVNSLATTEPKGQVEVRLMSRGNEILATKRSDAAGRVTFEAGLTRGEGALSPAMLVADRCQGRLRLPQPEGPGVRSDRPRRVGPPGAGRARCLRLHRARRLSLRRDRAHHRAAARRQGAASLERAADAGGRAAGRARISPRRGGRSGRRRPLARACRSIRPPRPAPGGSRAFTDPKRPAVGEATLPGRGLRRRPHGVRARGAGRTDLPRPRPPS